MAFGLAAYIYSLVRVIDGNSVGEHNDKRKIIVSRPPAKKNGFGHVSFSEVLPSFFRIKKIRNLFEYQAPATKPHARKDTINVWSITSTLCIPHITGIHFLVYWSVFEDLDSLYQPQSNALFLQLNSLRIYQILHFMIPRIISKKKKYDDPSRTGVMMKTMHYVHLFSVEIPQPIYLRKHFYQI